MPTSPFSLRFVRPEDAAAIQRIYAPIVRETAISLELEPPSEAEMRARIVKYTENYPWIVATDESAAVIGYGYASQHRERLGYRWSVDVSAYVHSDHRGRGLGKAIYEKLLSVLRAQGFANAYAGIGLPNAASVALHESCGFRPIGIYRRTGYKLGKWYDVGWWGLELNALGDDPREPKPWRDLEK